MRQNIVEIISTPTGETLQYFHEGVNEFLRTQSGIRYPINEDIICSLNDISLTRNNKLLQDDK